MKLGLIKSLKPMLNLLLPSDGLWEQVYDYIPLLLAEYQGRLEALFITQVRGRVGSGLGWRLEIFGAPKCPGWGVSSGWEIEPWGLAPVGFPRNERCHSRWKG